MKFLHMIEFGQGLTDMFSFHTTVIQISVFFFIFNFLSDHIFTAVVDDYRLCTKTVSSCVLQDSVASLTLLFIINFTSTDYLIPSHADDSILHFITLIDKWFFQYIQNSYSWHRICNKLYMIFMSFSIP